MKTLRLVAQPLLVAVVLAVAARGAVRLYAIPSPSMEPTLRAGDHILVTPYHLALPRRGDVVVFHSPLNPSEFLVKRIVAVPGDHVESRGGRLVICGHTLAEPYLPSPSATGEIASQIVPPASYFVLGDNRANSFDSRQWGTLPRALIVGRARLVLWSSPDDTVTPRASAAPIAAKAAAAHSFGIARLFRPIE